MDSDFFGAVLFSYAQMAAVHNAKFPPRSSTLLIHTHGASIIPPLNSADAQALPKGTLRATGHCACGAAVATNCPRSWVCFFCVLCFFCVEVFVVVVCSFGSPSPFSVRFVFRWAGLFGSVVGFAPSRSGLARLLWRFRRARRWWRSSSAPSRAVVGASLVPRFGLRWLALRWCVVVVRASSSSFGSLVPAARFRRCPSSAVPASAFSSPLCRVWFSARRPSPSLVFGW